MIGKDTAFAGALEQYAGYIKNLTHAFPERHREDLYQEGLIALESALRTYDAEKNVPRDAYVKLCIKRRVLTAYEAACKDDGAVAIDGELCDGTDIEADIVEKKYTEELFSALRKTLTAIEKNVLTEYLKDKSYSAIAAELGITEKAVDNALVRIRSKIKNIFPDSPHTFTG